MTYNVIEDLIGDVVTLMRSDPTVTALNLDATLPRYIYGHRSEVAARIAQLATSPSQSSLKFPLVALKLDTAAVIVGQTMSFNLNIVIVAGTGKNKNAEQRLADVFKPVLFPLYKSFMEQLRKSRHFKWDKMQMENPPHTKIDRYYYGTPTDARNTENIFFDPTDAIEILDLKLNRNIKYC